MKIIFLLLLPFLGISQGLKATYKIVSKPSEINRNHQIVEDSYLFINQNSESYFFSEHFLKIDSILINLDSGNLDPYKELANFNSISKKNLIEKTIDVFRELDFDKFKFTVNNSFEWEILNASDTLISNYNCKKALGNYFGRKYVAYFTEEIPIMDGPYVFNGLPGLILKINDTENKFEFVIISVEKLSTKFSYTPYKYEKSISISHIEFIKMREELTINPLKRLIESGLTIDLSNQTSKIPQNFPNVNYIER